MSRLTRDRTVEPVSWDQILRREWRQGNINFPCSAHHEKDWHPYSVDPSLLVICDDHTYIHTMRTMADILLPFPTDTVLPLSSCITFSLSLSQTMTDNRILWQPCTLTYIILLTTSTLSIHLIIIRKQILVSALSICSSSSLLSLMANNMLIWDSRHPYDPRPNVKVEL